MWNPIAEFFFKFKSIQFDEGNIVFQSGAGLYFFGLLFLLLLGGLIYLYFSTDIYRSRNLKAVSLTLRIVALFLLCFPLFEPVLLTPDILPRENFLVILADKSSSMTIPDGYFGDTRDNDISRILFNDKNPLIRDLQENYKIRYYSFSNESERVDSLSTKSAAGKATNILQSLKRVVSDFKGLPLSGIVLFTDGCDNSNDDPYDTISELKSLNIPLHIIGLGSEDFEQERELLEISTNKGLDEQSGAEINIKVRSWNQETEPVFFNIMRDDRRLLTEKKYLKGDGKVDYFTFFFEPEEKGTVKYTLQMDRLPDEINTDNNFLDMLVDTRKDTVRILYFEGQLRSEFKFIKRALEDDQVFQFTSASRTGTEKYYRQGINSPEELYNGFPETEEEMFKYKAVIFGDIEKSFFTDHRLALLEKFVRVRGGGFLMIGGVNSFTESDYWDSPVADILPVELDPTRNINTIQEIMDRPLKRDFEGYRFIPTREGLESPILKLVSNNNSNRALWNEMPALKSINYIGELKPGATILAVKPKDQFGDEEPLLTVQRYGRGRSAVLATSSTWRWKMLMDSENKSHDRFWKQMGRWLISSAPDLVNIDIENNTADTGENISIRFSVYDSDFNSLDFVNIKCIITDPLGKTFELPVHPDLNQEGEYFTSFTPEKSGIYTINAEAAKDGAFIGSDYQSFLAANSKKEFYNATLKKEFLQNLAKETNGVYYDPSGTSDIALNLKTKKSETSIIKSNYLWDMPILFLLALLILCIEWLYRRRQGLP